MRSESQPKGSEGTCACVRACMHTCVYVCICVWRWKSETSMKLLFTHLDVLLSTVKALFSFLEHDNKIRVTEEIKAGVLEQCEIVSKYSFLKPSVIANQVTLLFVVDIRTKQSVHNPCWS